MILDDIKTAIFTALKNGEKLRLEVLRSVVSEVRYAAIDKYGADGDTKSTDEDVLDVIRKMVKKHTESIEAFEKANRSDLSQKELDERSILQSYLPAELTDDQIREKLLPLQKSQETNFGLLMKQAMQIVGKSANGKRVADILKSLPRE